MFSLGVPEKNPRQKFILEEIINNLEFEAKKQKSEIRAVK